MYKDGYHLPPGGAYFCPGLFVSSVGQPACSMIAVAFADFRTWVPVFRPFSEKSDYFNILGVKDQQVLKSRLLLDILGTIATGLEAKMDVLVLGAGGCGAFGHDPRLEARLWRRVINSQVYNVRLKFKKLVFAIIGDRNGKNGNLFAFAEMFPLEEEKVKMKHKVQHHKGPVDEEPQREPLRHSNSFVDLVADLLPEDSS